jgi:hypothetical protein
LSQSRKILPASTTKKALVRRFQKRDPGRVRQPGCPTCNLRAWNCSPKLGNVSTVPYEEIKTIAFVRDFEGRRDLRNASSFNHPPENGRASGPASSFRDGEILEGILPNNLLPIDPHGFVVIPPDPNGNQQRIFVPRRALLGVEVLGVVGSPLRKRKPAPVSQDQIRLFEE